MGSLPLILAAASLCTSPAIHDGDTIRCGGERIRIANIDAPEVQGSPKCEARRGAMANCDYAAGNAAREALAAFLQSGPIMIERIGTDKYGRTLARVSVRGQDAGDYLVSRGLARRWRDMP